MKTLQLLKEKVGKEGYHEILKVELLNSQKVIVPWKHSQTTTWIDHLDLIDTRFIVDYKTIEDISRALQFSLKKYNHPLPEDLRDLQHIRLEIAYSEKGYSDNDDGNYPHTVFAKIEANGSLSLIAVFYDPDTPQITPRVEESAHTEAASIVWLEKRFVSNEIV